MLRLPRTRKQWIIATIASLAGFFFGGAIVAGVQKYLERIL